jgi:hypothetical protein
MYSNPGIPTPSHDIGPKKIPENASDSPDVAPQSFGAPA